MKAGILFGILMLIPLASAETGILSIDDNEIEIVVGGRTSSFNCNETDANFQFAIPECDKTEMISCSAERKYNTQKLDEAITDLHNCKIQLQNMKCPDNSNLIKENSGLKNENIILKILIGISGLLVVVMVAILMIFNYRKND